MALETKDKIGNPLKVGDLVYVRLDDPHVFGVIAEIHPGSTGTLVRGMLGGDKEPKAQLSVAKIALEQLAVTFHPENGIVANVVKVVDPTKPADEPTPVNDRKKHN